MLNIQFILLIMTVTFIILTVIFGGLAGYYFYTTRYFRDLYGDKSILTSRQLIRLDQRLWPGRVFGALMNLLMFVFGLSVFYLIYWIDFSKVENKLLFILIAVTVAVITISLPVLIYLIERKLKYLNRYDYIFDPEENSIELVGVTKIFIDDIEEIQFSSGGRNYGLMKRIICKDGRVLILSEYLQCFDVIGEFFGAETTSTYKDYNLFNYTLKLYNGSLNNSF